MSGSYCGKGIEDKKIHLSTEASIAVVNLCKAQKGVSEHAADVLGRRYKSCAV